MARVAHRPAPPASHIVNVPKCPPMSLKFHTQRTRGKVCPPTGFSRHPISTMSQNVRQCPSNFTPVRPTTACHDLSGNVRSGDTPSSAALSVLRASAVNLMGLREHSSPRLLATRHDRNVECATTNVTIFGEHPCYSSRLKAERVPARPPRPLGSRNVSSPWAFAASECASPARPPSDPT